MSKFEYEMFYERYEVCCCNTYVHGEWNYADCYNGNVTESTYYRSFEYDESCFSIRAMQLA